jgi:HEPN domain-containing protein
MDVAKHIAFWLESAREDWSASRSLLDKGHIRHGLFFVHLAVEKTIKAAVVGRTGGVPPKSHDLLRLATLANLDPEGTRRSALARVNQYCVEGRYPDNWGSAPSDEEAAEVVLLAEGLLEWLKQASERR